MNTPYLQGLNARCRGEVLESAPKNGPILFGTYPREFTGERWERDMQYEFWWRAGWHDKDMEIKKSEQGLRKTEAV